MEAFIIEELSQLKVQQGRHDEQILQTKSTVEKAWIAIDGIREAITDLKITNARLMVLVALLQSAVTATIVHFMTKS